MTVWIWIGFVIAVLAMLALDLGVFHKKSHVITIPEALAWTFLWVALALVFNVGLYFMYEHHWLGIGQAIGHELNGRQAALQFFTGYVIEKSLSLDNIFVIALIFSYFKVPLAYQHRVLFWGIFGALILRGLMILGGAVLLDHFSWMIYVFGALLILTAVKMLVIRHDNLEPGKNPLIKLAKRFFSVTDDYREDHFFVRQNNRRLATPLFLVLVMIESTDLLFAVDSIPAIFAITRDPFIVFTSNVFAILGLRSLYFALAGMMERFRYLKTSLVFVLAFVGVKMILSHHHIIPNWVSLCVIGGILGVGLTASLVASNRDTAKLISPLMDDIKEMTEITLSAAKRVVIIVVGSTILLSGVAMLVLPGPGIVVILLGLAVLGTEFAWARLWLKKIRRRSQAIQKKIRKRLQM